MRHYRLKVLDCYSYVNLWLYLEVVKVCNVGSDCRLQWVLEDLCVQRSVSTRFNQVCSPLLALTIFSVKLVKVI